MKMEKKKAWRDFGDKLERDNKDNQKLFYKMMKTLKTQKVEQSISIKNKENY